MYGQRQPGERGFNFASLNLDAKPTPKEDPKEKGDYSFATSLMQKVAEGSPKPKIKEGAELKWDGTKFVLHINGKQAPIKEKTPPTPQERTNNSGPVRNEERISPEGLPQTGTRTGPTPMTMEDLQQYLGKDVQIKNPFLSNALPGTNDDGYSYGDAIAMGANPDEAATRAGGGELQVTIDRNTPIETKMVQGSANLVLSGTGSAAPTGEKTNNPKDSSTWDEKYARRRAFLDADSSMAGLKAAQAQKGIVYASGKHYINTGETDDKGNPLLEAIEGKDAKQDVNAYMRGAQGAEDLKAKYINIIQSIDGKSVEDEGMTINEYNKMYPNDNEDISLTDMPEHSQKDHTGRFNKFR